MADTYRLGIDDIEMTVTYADKAGAAIDLSTLEGWGIELRKGTSTVIGSFGFNFPGYIDDYYEILDSANGVVQWNFPEDLFTAKGIYYARLVCNYTSVDFDDGLRDISTNRINVFDIVYP